MDTDRLMQGLDKAIEMEEKGYKFYKETAAKSANKVTQKTFAYLAENEVLHIKSIKGFYDELKQKQTLPDIDLDDAAKRRSADATIFAKSISGLKEKIKPGDDDKKACEFAMGFEKDGYDYYKDMLKTATDTNLRKLLEFLMTEEDRHYDWIMKTYEYITDSKNWFMYEENSFPQG